MEEYCVEQDRNLNSEYNEKKTEDEIGLFHHIQQITLCLGMDKHVCMTCLADLVWLEFLFGQVSSKSLSGKKYFLRSWLVSVRLAAVGQMGQEETLFTHMEKNRNYFIKLFSGQRSVYANFI
ncbi:unnamed protein product, partial [Brenthis ino]